MLVGYEPILPRITVVDAPAPVAHDNEIVVPLGMACKLLGGSNELEVVNDNSVPLYSPTEFAAWTRKKYSVSLARLDRSAYGVAPVSYVSFTHAVSFV
jgi:hypothetical protein